MESTCSAGDVADCTAENKAKMVALVAHHVGIDATALPVEDIMDILQEMYDDSWPSIVHEDYIKSDDLDQNSEVITPHEVMFTRLAGNSVGHAVVNMKQQLTDAFILASRSNRSLFFHRYIPVG